MGPTGSQQLSITSFTSPPHGPPPGASLGAAHQATWAQVCHTASWVPSPRAQLLEHNWAANQGLSRSGSGGGWAGRGTIEEEEPKLLVKAPLRHSRPWEVHRLLCQAQSHTAGDAEDGRPLPGLMGGGGASPLLPPLSPGLGGSLWTVAGRSPLL